MTLVWSGVSIVLALILQAGLSRFLPDQAPLIDPFLLITIFVSLTRGENNGMLVGVAAAWAEEIQFGGQVLGLLGLTRVVLAFFIGQAGRRFLISQAPAQFALIFTATIADAWMVGRLADLFEVPLITVSLSTLAMRAVVNAVLGAAAFRLIERRLRPEPQL
jgi:hypothetical protein